MSYPSQTIHDRVSALGDRLAEARSPLSAYAEANELELVFDDNGLSITSAGEARDRRHLITTQLGPITDTFDDHAVPFVVIKDPYLPKPISDIDILVNDSEAANEALTAIGFELEDDTEPHRETYVRPNSNERIVIDLHLALSWRRVRYLPTTTLLDNRQRRMIGGESVPCPSLEDHIAIIAAHSLFKHNALSMFEVLETIHLLHDYDPRVDLVESRATRFNWQPQLTYFLDFVSKTDLAIETANRENTIQIEDFPVYYPLPRVVWIRGSKTIMDLATAKVRAAAISGIAYPLDLTQYAVEQRLGFSMRPMFDLISWMKRRAFPRRDQ